MNKMNMKRILSAMLLPLAVISCNVLDFDETSGLKTNGIGATIGTLSAQAVVNHFVYNSADPSWSSAWYVFAAYALAVGVLFTILFKDPQKQAKA